MFEIGYVKNLSHEVMKLLERLRPEDQETPRGAMRFLLLEGANEFLKIFVAD